MTELPDTLLDVMPSAAPTDEEIRAWQALPRDEQLRRLKAALSDPACAEVSEATMSDILRSARATATARRG